jgi:transglutaminase-like putative cysteine protease
MVSRKKALIAVCLLLLLLLGLGGAYFILSFQNPYLQQGLNYFTVSNIRQIYYPWITPITITITPPDLPRKWFDNIFNITIPPNIPNISIEVPPMELFNYGLIDPNMIMFIVQPDSASYPTRYWRLEAYDYYEMDWNKTLTGSYPHSSIGVPGSAELYTVYMNFTHSTSSSTMIPALFANYTIVNNSDYLIETLQGDLNSFNISMDQYNSTFLNGNYAGSGLSTLKYTVAGYPFDLNAISSNAGYWWQTPQYISDVYTQRPSYLWDNTTFRNFVESIDNSGNVFQTAMSALSLLTGGEYAYNLSILLEGGGAPQGEDPVLWFLEGKQGICVHFASAFVMALRQLEISARLVVGFVGGEITVDPQLGLVHIVRAINAHAWAEVWVPTTSGGGEWVQFDPTPGPAQNGTNTDPYVQGAYRLELSAAPPSVPRDTIITINANLTNATSGAPVSGAKVSFWIVDPVTMNRYSIGSDTTGEDGFAQKTTTLNKSFRVGPIVFQAEAYNQAISNYPIATNYTGILLTGNSNIIGMSATSTAPYNGDIYSLIRNQGGVQVQGRLVDPDCENDSIRGIPNVSIEIYHNGSVSPVASGFTDKNGYFSVYCSGSSLDLTDYIFTANYSGEYLGFNITPPTSAYDPHSIRVYVKPSLSIQVNSTVLRQNDTIGITANLTYDNETPIEGMSVSIYWDNSSIPGGSVQLIDSGLTNQYGIFATTNTVWERTGVIRVFANCSQNGRILGVNSSWVNVYVYDEGLIIIESAPSEAAIGTNIVVSGRVIGSDGNPKPYTSITIRFTGSRTQPSYQVTTNGSGYFTRSIYVSSTDFVTDYYVINATSNDPLFNALSTSRIIKIYVGTVIGSSGVGSQSLSPDGWVAKQNVESRSVRPSESAYITGVLMDALGNRLDGQTVSVYYGSMLLNSGITHSSGVFNITLNSSALSVLPVNALSSLNISYAGDEFHSGTWNTTKLHVFNNAQLVFQSPSVAIIGSNYDIRCVSIDSNGNPIMGRSISVSWNSTYLGSVVTSGSGTILYTYFIDPASNSEGNVTIGLALEDVSSNSATIFVRRSSDFGGLAFMLLYALQMGSEASWLLIIIVLAIVGIISVIYFARRMASREEAKTVTPIDLQTRLTELKELVNAGKFNDAVKLLYSMFTDTITQYSGITRAPNETTREFALTVIKKEGLNPQLVNGLTQAFEKARYSDQTLDKEEYNKAAKCFAELYSIISGGSLKLA